MSTYKPSSNFLKKTGFISKSGNDLVTDDWEIFTADKRFCVQWDGGVNEWYVLYFLDKGYEFNELEIESKLQLYNFLRAMKIKFKI